MLHTKYVPAYPDIVEHRPLTGDLEERFQQLLRRFDGRETSDQQGRADCPSCGVCDALTVTWNKQGIAVHCFSEDGCYTAEIVANVDARESDLFAAHRKPPKPKALGKPAEGERFVLLRPAVVSMVAEVTGLSPVRARNAGLLVQQIAHHMPRTSIIRDGSYWIARTAEDWTEEVCLSRDQVEDATAALVDAGLIEARLMKFAGRTMMHYRLIEEDFERQMAATR